MKKLLSIILAIFMIATLTISVSAIVLTPGGSFGDGFSWSLSYDGTLEITGAGEIWVSDKQDVPWYDHKDEIVSVTINEGITNVPYYAFFECANLESASLPSTLKEINANAFNNCPKLESVEIPNGVEEIHGMAFAFSGLKSVTIPDSVTYIDDAAFTMNPLESVTLSKNLTAIGSKMFAYCENLKSITIPEGVKTIYYQAFAQCTALEEIILPDTLEYITQEAFYFCESLTQIELPSSLEIIGKRAFYASGLTSLTLPEGLKTLEEEALSGTDVTGLLIIPDSVTSMGKNIFSRADFTEVVLGSGMETVNLESINHMFSLVVSEQVKEITGTAETVYITDVHYMGEKENLTVENEKLRNSVHCIDYIDAVGPTCVKDGHEAGYYCEDCDAYFVNTGAVTDEKATGIHIYEEYKSDENATCTNDGTKTAYCIYNCGEKDTVTDVDSKLGHDEQIIPAVASTCTEFGKSEGLYCNRCKTTLVSPGIVQPIPHKYEKFEVYIPSTCIQNGWERAFCEYGCGAWIPRMIEGPLPDHIASDVWEGYDEDGHFHRCTVCDKSVDLTAHTYGEWSYTPYINLDGVLAYEKTAYCTVCGHINTVQISEEEYEEAIGGKTPETPEEPTPDTPDEPTDDACDHLCHKDGFMGFIWKIVKFFSKLFKLNPVCECGAAHY